MPQYRDGATKRTRYDKLRAALWTERQSGFDPHWQELADYYMPRRVRFHTSDRNRGDKRTYNIIDSTGRFAARTCSSGLHSGLTSPARPWMKLTTPDPDLANFAPVKEWLHIVTRRMLDLFATSNVYNVLPLVYLDMAIFGTAAMGIIADAKDLFRCYSYPIGSFALALDSRGSVNTWAREYALTVRQIVEQFGVREDGRSIDWSRISPTVKSYWTTGDYEIPIDVCWMVQPNEDARPNALDAKYLPFSSCYFELGTGQSERERQEPLNPNVFLRESGFRTFPIMAPRWDATLEDTYGNDSPGMTALGDVKQLQVMQRRKAQLLTKAVDPPLKGPSSLRTQKTSLASGDITFVDVRDGMQGLAPIHEVRLEGFQHITADINEVKFSVRRAFYEDLFLMLATGDQFTGERPTAREVEERHEEKLLALGPMLERTDDELLIPVVDRVYDFMEFNQFIPPIPRELQGVKLKIEFTSILAQAQKLVGVVSQDRFLQTVAGIASVAGQDALDKLDTDQAIDNSADMLGVDPRIVVPTDQARETRRQRRKQQQALMEAEAAANVGKAVKDAGQAPLTGDTVLNRMVQSQADAAAGG